MLPGPCEGTVVSRSAAVGGSAVAVVQVEPGRLQLAHRLLRCHQHVAGLGLCIEAGQGSPQAKAPQSADICHIAGVQCGSSHVASGLLVKAGGVRGATGIGLSGLGHYVDRHSA